MKHTDRHGFTLIEMLVVIGIIAILIGASIGGYAKMTRTAERARAQEVVNNAATALTALFQADGVWPRALRTDGTTGRLDKNHAFVLAKRGFMSLSTDKTPDKEATKLDGIDQFGIVTPWAAAGIKRAGKKASESTNAIGASGTVEDHILYYALDLDGDGVIKGAKVGGSSIDVRATAIVWSCGKDGKVADYKDGKGEHICSWSKGQTEQVK